jgi:transcriptional regulator with XRE-family HTH domain
MEGRHLVREARKRAGLTQAELAARAGTTQSAIARLERGRSSPSFARVLELIGACGLEVRLRLVQREANAPFAGDDPIGLDPQGRYDGAVSSAAGAADEVLRTLGSRGVRWVLIGGLAAALHGVPDIAPGLVVVAEESRRNLEALAAALEDLSARVRAPGGSLPMEREAATIAGSRTWPLVTVAGDLDLDLRPPGTRGHADLAGDAVAVTVSAVELRVASLADLVRIAEAADEPDEELVASLRRTLTRTGI